MTKEFVTNLVLSQLVAGGLFAGKDLVSVEENMQGDLAGVVTEYNENVIYAGVLNCHVEDTSNGSYSGIALNQTSLEGSPHPVIFMENQWLPGSGGNTIHNYAFTFFRQIKLINTHASFCGFKITLQ